MSKIPMQIYFDPDTANFYKLYARGEGKSFARVIREIVMEKKFSLLKKTQKKGKIKIKAQNHPLIKAFEEVEQKMQKTPYRSPQLTDDELIYGQSR